MASGNWSQCLCIGVGSPQLATGISVSLDGVPEQPAELAGETAESLNK